MLGLLANGERYGYSLKRIIDEEFAPFWRIDHAQLYRSLAKLTRSGWVTVRTEPGVGAPERKVYALSAEGKRVFVAWLSEPADDRNEFFVKLRLAHESQAPIAPLVEARRHLLNHERLARLQARNVAAQSGDIGRLALARAALHLDAKSRILVINTEGATDPARYAELVGEHAEVLRRRAS